MDGDRVDLRELDLRPGAAVALAVPVGEVALRLGGQDYRLVVPGDAALDLSRSLSGLHLRLRVAGELEGPCWRCLGPARVPIAIDAREFAADDRDPAGPADEDLDSAYVEDELVDAALWIRDAVAEAVPPTILCRPDCAGLCPTCGADRNVEACACAEAAGDPRWDALREIARDMGLEDDAGGR
jgi:uncharacterized protein